MATENNKNQAPVKTVTNQEIKSAIRSFHNLFLFAGILLVAIAIYHIYISSRNGSTDQSLFVIINDLIGGFAFILCAFLLERKSAWVMFVYSAWLLYLVISTVITHSWLNIIAIVVGLVFWTVLYVFRMQGSLR